MPSEKAGKAEHTSAPARSQAPVAAPAALTGVARLISTEAEAAIAGQSWESAGALHALDQRVQEVLAALPAAVAGVDETSDIGMALKALGILLA